MASGKCWCGKLHRGAAWIDHRRESGRFRARFKDLTGRIHFVGTFDSLDAAKQSRDTAMGAVATGTWQPLKDVPTLAEYARTWLDRGRVRWAPNTYAKYASPVRWWISSSLEIKPGRKLTLGDYPLDSITKGMVADWHAAVLRNGTESTAVTAYCALRAIFISAVDEDLLATSPVKIKGAATLNKRQQRD